MSLSKIWLREEDASKGTEYWYKVACKMDVYQIDTFNFTNYSKRCEAAPKCTEFVILQDWFHLYVGFAVIVYCLSFGLL